MYRLIGLNSMNPGHEYELGTFDRKIDAFSAYVDFADGQFETRGCRLFDADGKLLLEI